MNITWVYKKISYPIGMFFYIINVYISTSTQVAPQQIWFLFKAIFFKFMIS
jgi:hypothetical protein